MQDYDYKVMIFESWFDRRIKKYKHARNGKLCDSEIIIKHNGFVRTFNNAYKRFMRHYTERNECFCDCVMLAWDSINSFTIEDDSNWRLIATGKDPKNYGKLVTYTKKHILFEIERMHYKKVCTSKTINTDEGKKRFLVWYNIEPESLNRLTNWKNEHEKIELINCFEESYWNKHEEYQMSIFMQWAIDNIDKKINAKQKELLEQLAKINYSRLEKCDAKIEGVDMWQVPQRLKRIYEKLAKEFKAERKFLTGGFAIQSLEAEKKVHQKIMNVVNDDLIDPNQLNQKVSAQILKSLNNTHFAKLMYDNLNDRYMHILIQFYKYCAIADGEGFQLFAESSIYNPIIYEIISLVEDRIEWLDKRIQEETELLIKQAKDEGVEVSTMQFQIDGSKKVVHLKMNSFGIAVPKY